jgi:hypothetical protein
VEKSLALRPAANSYLPRWLVKVFLSSGEADVANWHTCDGHNCSEYSVASNEAQKSANLSDVKLSTHLNTADLCNPIVCHGWRGEEVSE